MMAINVENATGETLLLQVASVYGYVIFWPSKYFAKFFIFWAKLSSIPVHYRTTLYEMQARELGSSFKALRKGSVEKLKSSLDSESEKWDVYIHISMNGCYYYHIKPDIQTYKS